MNHYQSFYDHLTGHRCDFLGDQCLVGKPGQRSDDFYYHRCPRPHFWWHTLCPRTPVVIRLRPIIKNDCQHSDCHSSEKSRSTYRWFGSGWRGKIKRWRHDSSRSFFIWVARFLLCQQSGLTGESESVWNHWPRQQFKSIVLLKKEASPLWEPLSCLVECQAVVLAVGVIPWWEPLSRLWTPDDCFVWGEMNSISWLLIRLMLVMVPIVFVQWFNRWRLVEAGVFALKCWCWLTPRCFLWLSASLAKGSIIMARKKWLSRNQCHTGLKGDWYLVYGKPEPPPPPLTQDEIVLEYPWIYMEIWIWPSWDELISILFSNGLEKIWWTEPSSTDWKGSKKNTPTCKIWLKLFKK